MNKYKVTAPDGSIHKRSSQNRTYTHTVLAQGPETKRWYNCGWCGSAELAVKLSNTRKVQRLINITILEAEKA